MKKIIALVLALVMVLSLGTVAFAKSGQSYDLGKATRKFNGFVAQSVAHMLREPATALADFVDGGAEALADEVDKVANEVNAAATEMQTALKNTYVMAKGLIWTVKTVYQAGGYALRFAGKIFKFDNDKAFFTGDNTIDEWLARCIENADEYAMMANGTVWNVADKANDVLVNVINETALDETTEDCATDTLIGSKIENTVKAFTQNYRNSFERVTSGVIFNYLNNLFSIPADEPTV